jgi:hypothetical protein
MPKKPRPPKGSIPASANNTQILALLRSMDIRLARLEEDDDRRSELVAEIRAKRTKQTPTT